MSVPPTIDRNLLISYASEPESGLTQAFAGMILSSLRAGARPPASAADLGTDRFTALVDTYFPGLRAVLPEDWAGGREDDGDGFRAEEIEDVLGLLLEYRSDDSDCTRWLAVAIAVGCMGQDHLYQDMGLPNRQALSELLKVRFTGLFERNVGNMKWKKFFYKQLCDRAAVNLCKAPSCQVCNDYHQCFGPEDESGLGALTGQSRA